MLMASVYLSLVQYQPSVTEVSEQLSQFKVLNGRPWRAAEFGRFCRGEPRNFVSWSTEFGKIFRGKLWAIVIGCETKTFWSSRIWLLEACRYYLLIFVW